MNATAVTPEQEQEAIKQVREQVAKSREEFLKKLNPADRSPANLLQALSALRLNVDVEKANEAIQKHAAEHPMPDGHPDFYPFMPIYAQIYYLFSSKSPYFSGRLTSKTEAVMKEQMFRYLDRSQVAEVSLTEPLQILSTENHDLRGRTSIYLFSAVLKDDPEYRDRKNKLGSTPVKLYEAYNEFYKRNLKARALNGLWFEVGCAHYGKMSWMAMLVMADVAPDETVRRYAKMVLDLAWVEEAEMSFGIRRFGGGFRGGSGAGNEFLGQFAPLMFGDSLQGVNSFAIPWAVSDYQLPDIAILLHRFGAKEPACEIINKVLSFSARTQCQGGPLVNYTYRTPTYALGGVMFDPAGIYSAISMDQSWQGLVFNDQDKTHMQPYPEARGREWDTFWHVQYKNVMVGQKYKNFRVKRMGVFIPPNPEREEVDDWVFVNLGDAFAAVRPAYGGYTWDTAVNRIDKATGKSGVMLFNDEWAPMILHAADLAEFGSYAAFKEKILKAELKVTDDAVIYKGPSQPAITFYHKQLNEMRTTTDNKVARAEGPGNAGKLKLPEIDGKPVNLRPTLSYQSPFLSSVPGTEKVRTAFGSLVKEYDFGK